MKKTRILALLITLLVLVTAIVGCGPDECAHESIGEDGKCTSCGEQINQPEVPPTVGEGEIALVTNGKPNFHFVLGSGASSAVTDLDKLIEKLNKALTTGAERVGDSKDTVQDVEILIGSTTQRGNEYKIDEHYLGYKGWEVKMIGQKLVVLAGDPDKYEDALEYLEKEVFGLTGKNVTITNLVVGADCGKRVDTTYNITSAKIAGNDLDKYVLAVPKSNDELNAFAKVVRDTFYRTTGVYFDIVNLNALKDNQLAIKLAIVENDKTSDGFRAFVDDKGNLVLECMYPEKFLPEAEKILIDEIAATSKSKINITEDYSATANLRVIRYEDFGAKGDGFTNDFPALKATHDYANLWGHTVVAKPGANYYIGETYNAGPINIKTDVVWTDATFTIDDTVVTYNDPNYSDYYHFVFRIQSDYHSTTYKPTGTDSVSLAIKALNDAAASNGGVAIRADECTSFDLGLGYPVLVCVWSDHINYIREGSHYEGGSAQREWVLLDAEGNLDGTPFMYDYAKITQIDVYRVDDAPITITGGTQITIANQTPLMFDKNGTPIYKYCARGLICNRSNVTISNYKQQIVGEGDEGAPYHGSISTSNCNNFLLVDSEVQAHKNYSNMGSYALSPGNATNIVYRNVTQTNFFLTDGETPSVGNGYWGVMGSNYCKNLTYDACRLSRFDAHCGLYNGYIINGSEVADLTLIGKGEFIISDSTIHTGVKNYLVPLRGDYGSTWTGSFEISNTTAVFNNLNGKNDFYIFNGTWVNHYFGYPCAMPEYVSVDNLTINYTSASKGQVINVGLATGSIATGEAQGINKDTLLSGTKNLNPYTLTKEFYVYNNTKGYNYSKTFNCTKMYIDGKEKK